MRVSSTIFALWRAACADVPSAPRGVLVMRATDTEGGITESVITPLAQVVWVVLLERAKVQVRQQDPKYLRSAPWKRLRVPSSMRRQAGPLSMKLRHAGHVTLP